MKQLAFLLLLIAVMAASCWEAEEKRFVCGTCEEQKKLWRENYIPDSVADGKALFLANCASCHKANDTKSVGPGLRGTRDRVPAGDWIYRYVRNEAELRKSGDAYASAIFKKYNGLPMSTFPELTNEDIDAIFDYVDYVNK